MVTNEAPAIHETATDLVHADSTEFLVCPLSGEYTKLPQGPNRASQPGEGVIFRIEASSGAARSLLLRYEGTSTPADLPKKTQRRQTNLLPAPGMKRASFMPKLDPS